MKKLFHAITVFLICFVLFPMSVSADIGPKASVQVTFKGVKNQEYYATLLSYDQSTGPASAWDGRTGRLGNANYEEGEEGYEIWKKFVEYEDADGYYFLQEFWDVSETHLLDWGYYPPYTFKVLLYFPESDSFRVSEVYERYAFDSYFTVNVSEDGTELLTVRKSYRYGWEIISLIVRIVLTILLEVVIAWFFGYRKKRALRFIMTVNVFTQIILNVLLNVANYKQGPWAFVLYYILMEIIVLIIEATLYRKTLPKLSEGQRTKKRASSYAITANIMSFIVGCFIAKLIPGIF